MQSEQVYLDSDLTLPKLAALVKCPVNHLSQVINSGFNMSFFDYLNQYRIEDAKKLLSLEDGQLQAILSIAFEVGFNSNSAFYAAFKKSCGHFDSLVVLAQRIEFPNFPERIDLPISIFMIS